MLGFQTLILYLHIEAISAENVDVVSSRLLRRVVMVVDQIRANLSAQTGGQTNEPFTVFGQKFFVDSRFVVEALQKTV